MKTLWNFRKVLAGFVLLALFTVGASGCSISIGGKNCCCEYCGQQQDGDAKSRGIQDPKQLLD